MAVSLMQKIRLALRGWMRRRGGDADRRNAEFLKRNAGWSAPPESAGRSTAAPGRARIDLEGLQVAYLDDSGQIEHYLDTASGEVIDIPSVDGAAARRARENAAYRRVPGRTGKSEAEDRAAFLEAMEPSPVRNELQGTLSMADAAKEFRKILARDRPMERAWYNFKNDRASAAIEEWLTRDGDAVTSSANVKT